MSREPRKSLGPEIARNQSDTRPYGGASMIAARVDPPNGLSATWKHWLRLTASAPDGWELAREASSKITLSVGVHANLPSQVQGISTCILIWAVDTSILQYTGGT